MTHGILTGSPVVDFRITLFDGSYHTVDSSEMAFKIAASMGFKDALAQARPILLEPIMHLEITVPDESMGDVIGDFHMSFSYYEEVPPHLSERVIKEVRETRGVTGQHHHE